MADRSKGNCFVVMPYGRDEEEVAWFAGWYKECVSRAVRKAGYVSVLAATEHKPIAINDDIRAHLVFDPMVICDLGGMTPDDPPNPNVMYELGIRHAFGHPLVIMAWKGQRIPFDVANQRIIMENRRLLDVETNIDRIVTYIGAAEHGDYYRPMDAVARTASLELSTSPSSSNAVLRNLVTEVASLKDVIGAQIPREVAGKSKVGKSGKAGIKPHHSQIFHMLGTGERREAVKALLERRGIEKKSVNSFLTHSVPADLLPSARTWDVATWADYIAHRMMGSQFDTRSSAVLVKGSNGEEGMAQKVQSVPIEESRIAESSKEEPPRDSTAIQGDLNHT